MVIIKKLYYDARPTKYQVILYSVFYFMSYPSIYVNYISYIKAVSIVYWNIPELQPEDGLKMRAKTCSCHYILNII